MTINDDDSFHAGRSYFLNGGHHGSGFHGVPHCSRTMAELAVPALGLWQSGITT